MPNPDPWMVELQSETEVLGGGAEELSYFDSIQLHIPSNPGGHDNAMPAQHMNKARPSVAGIREAVSREAELSGAARSPQGRLPPVSPPPPPPYTAADSSPSAELDRLIHEWDDMIAEAHMARQAH